MENNELREESTLAYGKNAVTELLKSGSGVDTVFVQDSMNEAMAGYYTALAKEAGAVVKRVHTQKLNNICGNDNHQGVAAYASSIEYLSLEELMAKSKERSEAPFYVLCDGIEDPHNLGAIMRSALLCGAHGVVIPKRGGVSVTPVVMKASAGAAVRLPVARVANIGEAVRRLKAANVFVYCADMDGESLERTNLTGAIALVVGNEGSGVSHLVKTLCDGSVSLAMANTHSGIDSYNVSVASGIVLYEIMRQRTK
ncbi:MAG: 23S rRNA (guanosine(2251)-2'-O)-methyltransferase RlmB [Oscillospiraceae bacterium]